MEQKKEDKPNPGFIFQSEFETSDTIRTISDLKEEEEPRVPSFQGAALSGKIFYRIRHHAIRQYHPGQPIPEFRRHMGPYSKSPNLGGLITLSISDLMEDYRFSGGFRIPTSFSGSEYFMRFDHLKNTLG